MIGFHGLNIIHFNQYYHLVGDVGNNMAKKGSVRRMDSSVPNSSTGKVDLSVEMPVTWKKVKNILSVSRN